MHNSEPENFFFKSDLCGSPKILGQPPGPQERTCGGGHKVSKHGTDYTQILSDSVIGKYLKYSLRK